MTFIRRFIIAAATIILAAACSSDRCIYRNEAFTWKGDTISLNDGSIKAYAPDSYHIISDYPESEFPEGEWTLTRDISHLPSYSAPTVLEEALYNLSLEESVIAVEPDSTLRTGKNWSGVWTRDISYSILLSLAHVQTEASIRSLVRKVDGMGRIIQDTGTGGSWPCSTDRMIWAVAAWEIYKVTGDEDWLSYIYPIIKRSVEADLLVAYDPETEMMRGESSFLDWREQEYPRWMAPVDIYNSECLGTECVHYKALKVLSRLAERFGDGPDAVRYDILAEGIAQGMNNYLWMPEKGYYAQFLYGRQNLIASARSETLGEALAILYGIASDDQALQICSNVPQHTYGTACFFPNIKDIPPYHNDAMWPFVQAFWADACKKAGNETALLHSIASIFRMAAFCLTNKENMVLYDGRWQGTQINSSRQLWSIAGNLNIVYSVLFGMEWEENGLRFTPFVPKAMAGERKLAGFRYRGRTYDIVLEGYGNGIRSFTIDGKKTEPFIPACGAGADETSCKSLEGNHQVHIVLNGRSPKGRVNMMENAYSPLTPECFISDGVLFWNPVPDAVSYKVIRNGIFLASVTDCSCALEKEGEYQVIAVDSSGLESFASEPVGFFTGVTVLQMEDFGKRSVAPYAGYQGAGYLNLTLEENTSVEFSVDLPFSGTYAIDFLFGNANGPVNTKNMCAIRTLSVDGTRLGTVVMPHCGTDAFDSWRYTNTLFANLPAGVHSFRLYFAPEDHNMNIGTNSAALDAVRLIRL